MEIKRILLTVLAAVCVLTLFSSCEKHDQTDALYTYSASGELSSTGSGGMYTTATFQGAINSVVGSGPSPMNDAAVVVACDAVDAKIKADTGVKVKGYVEISRKGFNDSGKGTVLKKYTY